MHLLLFFCLQSPFQLVEQGPHAGSITFTLRDEELAHALAPAEWDRDTWIQVMPVYLQGMEHQPPMLGSWIVKDNRVYFKPRFGLLEGRVYATWFGHERARALLKLAATGRPRVAGSIATPHPKPPEPPRVTAVYPSAEVLPANVLRWYIHFSQPMGRHGAYHGIRILDDQDRPIEAPFVIVPEELWNHEGTRLTVLLDPGRIKRGVGPNRSIGAPLQAGRTYTLVVAERVDVRGTPLQEEWRKTFRVVQAMRERIQPKTWRIQRPEADSKDALSIALPRSLDAALLKRYVLVSDADGRVLEGTIALADQEQTWIFTPREIWRQGTYHVEIHPFLEDFCGNRMYRLFDEPDHGSGSETASVQRISFQPE